MVRTKKYLYFHTKVVKILFINYTLKNVRILILIPTKKYLNIKYTCIIIPIYATSMIFRSENMYDFRVKNNTNNILE